MLFRIQLFLAVFLALLAGVVSSVGGQDVPLGGGSTRVVMNSKLANGKDRRWNALMECCVGCWSGTIGWYDVEITKSENGEHRRWKYTLKPRSDNNKRNMRLSFRTREGDASTADWVVYHARGHGVREEVVLRNAKESNGDLPQQTFYCFEGGNLGRSGTDFMKLPAIEHGFWDVSSDRGERRTVVLVYNPHDGHLMKVCYLQQKKKVGRSAKNFDVSGIEARDIRIMPKKATVSFDCIRQKWRRSPKSKYLEVLDVPKYCYKRHEIPVDDPRSVLSSAFGAKEGKSDNVMCVSLPNGVLLSCPLSILSDDGTTAKSFNIAMGYQNSKGAVQLVGFDYVRCKLKRVTGHTLEV